MRSPVILFCLLIVISTSLGCSMWTGSRMGVGEEPGDRVSFRDLDPGIWIDTPANRAIDPYQDMIQQLRDRKARDLEDSNAPAAFGPKVSGAKEFRAPGAAWNSLEDVIPLDWPAIAETSPKSLDALRQAIRLRTVLQHPDFRIIELAMAPGARLPLHALADPSALHIIGGGANIVVGEQTIEASLGASILFEPYVRRSIHVTSTGPLRALWFRWAPGGDATYLDFGYYLTGANFHIQPLEATFPSHYEHWEDDLRGPSFIRPMTAAPSSRSSTERDMLNLSPLVREDRARLASVTTSVPQQHLYPTTPSVSSEVDTSWIDFLKLADAGFFWAKDAQAGGNLLSRWNEIARMKGVFRATRPDGPYDFNLSYIAIGPTGKYVTHSHAAPEFYYVLEGETEWIVDGETFIARPGHTYLHAPYWDHEMRGLVEGRPMRAITGSWAPFGDRTVWTKPGFLLEALPSQPLGAALSENFDFHDFPTKKLKFQSR